LDSNELKSGAAVLTFFNRCGAGREWAAKVSPEQMVEHFDNNSNPRDRFLDFQQWLQLLSIWKDLLPAQMQVDLAAVVANRGPASPCLVRLDLKLMGSSNWDRASFAASLARAIGHHDVHLTVPKGSILDLITFFVSAFVKTTNPNVVSAAMTKLKGNVLGQFAVCDWQNLTVRPPTKAKLDLLVFSVALEGSEPPAWDWKGAFARAVDVAEAAVTVVVDDVVRPTETRLLIEVVTLEPDALKVTAAALRGDTIASRLLLSIVVEKERREESPPPEFPPLSPIPAMYSSPPLSHTPVLSV